ncbi:MAG: AraC family transcriptional regulator [Phenylobacterium sp.]|uniref:helix-turn-helix domain-containing protein n=1 Tax=Phenylobacterium sp. TaxID=1871053 RepID=UPI001A5E6598|nr:helix-turn-helix domain-containing protein [Phenylobacterium sp.]MBL8770056.1 AraC family transcriptional regulator [Phenylobacterium sp.]
MTDSRVVLDLLFHGIAIGATAVIGLAVWGSGVSRTAQAATAALSVGIVAWLVCESPALWALTGRLTPLLIASFPISGLFWLFVVTVFEDRPLAPPLLLPIGLLLATGCLMLLSPRPLSDGLWVVHNLIGGGLAVHAMVVIGRGRTSDLVEGRRRLRGAVLGVSAAFVIAIIVFVTATRLDPDGPWQAFTAGGLYGGAAFAALMLAGAAVFLAARPGVFAPTRRPSGAADSRAEALALQLARKLDAFMNEGAWRQEGLTIAAVAAALGEPEHRLRRLINQRLGHRNFAEFVNGFRIEAAKLRLSDPADARTTIAVIAFDLGFGSLGPFNRAFRAVTGSTPTAWRRAALARALPELEEAV